jgi:diaminopimelate decarboxylase
VRPFAQLLFYFFEGGITMKLFGTMDINDMGNLSIGGCDAVNLSKKYGTPLYVMDVTTIREHCQAFKKNFTSKKLDTEVIYASKAFLTIGMCKLIEEEGLSLDVVSGGELYTAMKANFPANKIYFHGNNKTVEELMMAINYGVHRIVVDNEFEFDLLNYLCGELDKTVEILVRINPGIEAHTHEYIQTAHNDSKFGISIHNPLLRNLINEINDSYFVTLKGFHYHIGSQILEVESFVKATEAAFDFMDQLNQETGFVTDEMNLGGGFGVYYSEEDIPLDIPACLKAMLAAAIREGQERKMNLPKLLIEPGRSIVANSGTTLYKVGATKETYGGKHFVFVNGGMTDNPRTALYNSVYEAVIANKADAEPCRTYTVAGKCCESGDVVIKSINLPIAEKNDTLAVFSTGAYNYSMASNYNRLRKPAVVFVEDGKSTLVVKRETYEDIIRNDIG